MKFISIDICKQIWIWIGGEKEKRRKEKYKVEIIKKILHLQIQDYS